MRLVGIVRDGKTGLPKFDDPKNAPPEMKAMLTDWDILNLPLDVVSDLNLLEKRGELEAGEVIWVSP